MNGISRNIGIMLTAVAVSGCGDSENTLRQLQCYSNEKILPIEIQEIEKVTQDTVVQICGGYHIIDGTHPVDWGTRVNVTIITTQSGKIFSLSREINKLLIPQTVETKKNPAIPDNKYQIKQ